MKMAVFKYFRVNVRFLVEQIGKNSEKCIWQNMAISTKCDSQMDKPEHGHPKRAELPDVNITHAHKALRVRASLKPIRT